MANTLRAKSTAVWRVMCQTDQHPGQWQTWLVEQCCAVGWHPRVWGDVESDGTFWSLDGDTPHTGKAWRSARNALREMTAGDAVVAMLPHGKVGRIGEIVRVEADDELWRPVISARPGLRFGENGRRIMVRWDLRVGPADWGQVTQLPKGKAAFGQAAISRLSQDQLRLIVSAMNEEQNWVPFYGNFRFEKALSDYVAMHPYRLEDGLMVHPEMNPIREFPLSPENRIDVVLIDRSRRTVIVECKQDAVSEKHIEQLQNYIQTFSKKYGYLNEPRGILVHGGSRHVSRMLRAMAEERDIKLVYHELKVDFSSSS